MNKFAIPAILVATVMVAGAFAFMPVEEASTVHTTVQGTQLNILVLTDNDNMDIDGQIEVECDRPFVLYTLFITMANVVDGDAIAIIDIEVDEADIVIDGNGDGVATPSITDAFIVNDPGVGGSALVSVDAGALFEDNQELTFPIGVNANIDFILGAAAQIVDGDDITVKAVVMAENGAACNVNVEVAD